jgi:hypothetical protein
VVYANSVTSHVPFEFLHKLSSSKFTKIHFKYVYAKDILGIAVEYFDFGAVTKKIWGVTRIKNLQVYINLFRLFFSCNLAFFFVVYVVCLYNNSKNMGVIDRITMTSHYYDSVEPANYW